MTERTADAVIIGAGHHGLVSAALLADAGWDVVVLEGRSKPGGAVGSTVIDGFVVDEFSSCYPLGKASPVLKSLGLEEHGLEWVDHRPALVHVASADDDGGSPVGATPEETAAVLDLDHAGDGEQWMKMFSGWQRVGQQLVDALMTGWPPVRAGGRLVRTLGAAGLLDFGRFALLPSHRMGEEWFSGNRARDILAGNAAHADVSPLAPISGLLGWMLSMAAQDVGFAVPRGGAGALAGALASRARQAGAVIEVDAPVEQILVTDGRASGVRLRDGRVVRARRSVIADVTADSLYRRLLPGDAVPPAVLTRLEHFAWDPPTLKLNLLLDAGMPWRAERARSAAVVHAGRSANELVHWHADIATGKVPERAFALVGQTTTADHTRSPAGTESLWAYTHLPAVDDTHAEEATASSLASVEAMFDDLAPGWRDVERQRWLQTPRDLHETNPNLVGGAVGSGSSQFFLQGPFRPITGLGGPWTHVPGLYLASAAVHPGGAVHGGAGFNAARAAMRQAGWWSRPFTKAASRAQYLLQRQDPAF